MIIYKYILANDNIDLCRIILTDSDKAYVEGMFIEIAWRHIVCVTHIQSQLNMDVKSTKDERGWIDNKYYNITDQ